MGFWKGPSTGGNWSTASNWSDNTVPYGIDDGPADGATFFSPGDYTVLFTAASGAHLSDGPTVQGGAHLTIDISGGSLTFPTAVFDTVLQSGGTFAFDQGIFNTITQTGGTLAYYDDTYIDTNLDVTYAGSFTVSGGGSFAGTLDGWQLAQFNNGTYSFKSGFVDNLASLSVDTAKFLAPITIGGGFSANNLTLLSGATPALTLNGTATLRGTMASTSASPATLAIGKTGTVNISSATFGSKISISVAGTLTAQGLSLGPSDRINVTAGATVAVTGVGSFVTIAAIGGIASASLNVSAATLAGLGNASAPIAVPTNITNHGTIFIPGTLAILAPLSVDATSTITGAGVLILGGSNTDTISTAATLQCASVEVQSGATMNVTGTTSLTYAGSFFLDAGASLGNDATFASIPGLFLTGTSNLHGTLGSGSFSTGGAGNAGTLSDGGLTIGRNVELDVGENASQTANITLGTGAYLHISTGRLLYDLANGAGILGDTARQVFVAVGSTLFQDGPGISHIQVATSGYGTIQVSSTLAFDGGLSLSGWLQGSRVLLDGGTSNLITDASRVRLVGLDVENTKLIVESGRYDSYDSNNGTFTLGNQATLDVQSVFTNTPTFTVMGTAELHGTLLAGTAIATYRLNDTGLTIGSGATLVNQGAGTQAGDLTLGGTAATAAVLNNGTTGTYTLTGDGNINVGAGGTATFVNDGGFAKTGGIDVSTIAAGFTNDPSGSILGGAAILTFTAPLTNAGAITVNGGTVIANAAITGGGAVYLSHAGEFDANSSVGVGQGVLFQDPTGVLELAKADNFNGFIAYVEPGDKIILTAVTYNSTNTVTYDPGSGKLSLDNSGGTPLATFQMLGNYSGQRFVQSLAQGTAAGETKIQVQAACFAAGTRIATPGGDMPVEALRAGDRVRIASGKEVAAVWVGHRRVDCAGHPRPSEVWPVRIAAGAFGPARPRRELWLSPDHAVFVEGDADLPGVLIPVKHLVNGTTIAQVPVDEITYYHVELPDHEVLLAEGLAVESYLDTGNRSSFSEGGGAIALFPDFASHLREACGFASLVVTGPGLDAARARVNALAIAVSNPPMPEIPRSHRRPAAASASP